MAEDRKKHLPSPPVVISTGCSRLKSCLSLCRPPADAPSAPLLPSAPGQPSQGSSSTLPPGDGKSAAETYWRRARQLELELNQLTKWLNTEGELTQCLSSNKMKTTERREELIRLEDGSYLHSIKQVSRPWGELAMQLSAPAISENCSTASEVLQWMVSMKADGLRDFLRKSMPMSKLRCGRMRSSEEMMGKPVLAGKEDGFLEAIFSHAMERIEVLALEGLRIQMCTSSKHAMQGLEKERRGRCVVIVTMIQIRDPQKGYEAVGEEMIGLIEASASDADDRAFHVEGVTVAGMKCRDNRMGGGDFMWSSTVEGCKARNGCLWECVRKADLVFPCTRMKF